MGDDLFATILERARRASLTNGADAERLAANDAAKLRAERLARCRETLPDDDYQRVLDGKLDSPAWAIVQRFLGAFDAGNFRYLWLCGGPGTGKTVAFAGVLAERGGRLVLGSELVRAFRGFDRDSSQMRHEIKSCSVLVLDDLGTTDGSTEATALFEVLNARQGGRCMTLITGNQTKREIEAMDPRIVSRLKKQGAIVELNGDDMRIGPRRG